ncbi:MAG: alpha/beta hydrolase family protein [Bacteroidota bacterium]
MKNLLSAFLITILSFGVLCAFAARVDTLDIASGLMKRSYKAVIVTPDTYAASKLPYPVVYLLHGGTGKFSDWVKKTPDKMLVQNLADQYNLIFVLPEGETFSFYLDSPVDKGSQFETYLTVDVMGAIDKNYRTVNNRAGRVITGLSMGGHGALYLSARHPDLYCAAGSMSGAVDMKTTNWIVTPESVAPRKARFEKILGPDDKIPDQYAIHSVINMVDKMKSNNLKLIIDCGVDDYLIKINRELHQRLVDNKTPHDYTERPGSHTWQYWQNALPYQVLFLYQVLRDNNVTVPR